MTRGGRQCWPSSWTPRMLRRRDSRALVFRMDQDPGVVCRAEAAWTLWLLGYPAHALARLHEVLTLAQELSHPYSLAWVRCWATYVYQCCRDVSAVHAQAEAAMALSTARGFPHWPALGMCLRGWALAMQGQGEEGVAQVRQGLCAYRATGVAMGVPYFCTALADVCAHLGHREIGRASCRERV